MYSLYFENSLFILDLRYLRGVIISHLETSHRFKHKWKERRRQRDKRAKNVCLLANSRVVIPLRKSEISSLSQMEEDVRKTKEERKKMSYFKRTGQ